MEDGESPWTGDVNEAVIEEWKDETSSFERVNEVLLTTTSFQYASTIAERARVSEPSARKYLQILADSGLAKGDTDGQRTRYKRSRESIAMQRMQEIHQRLTREELIAGIQDLKRQIKAFQEEHGVTDPNQLALELEDPEDDDWQAISRWQAAQENLEIAQAALSLYDYDPDDGDRTASSGEPHDGASSSGAFDSSDVGNLPV